MAKLQQTEGSMSSFRVTNFTTDPFAVSTWSIAIISWIIAFAGSLASDLAAAFPKFTWWGLVYQLVILIMIFIFYGFDMVDQYKVFLTGALSVAFLYTTNSATNLVWTSGSPQAAASAGVVLLSMVNIIWIFYYGGDNSSPVNQWIDSFSLRGPRSSSNPFHSQQFNGTRLSTNDPQYDDDYRRSTWSNQKYVSSTRLNGLENLSERDNNTTGTPIYDIPENEDTHISTGTMGTGMTGMTTDGSNLVIDDFPYTARALYSYESSPDDENEISFEKGEILKVNDIHSRWWQAKRSNGEIGICPSNYVELIE